VVMDIKPLSEVMGARVVGLDPTSELSESELRDLESAFLEYHVLCIEAEPLTSHEFFHFAKNFGNPQKQLLRNQWDNQYPEVSLLESTYVGARSKPDDLSTVRLSGWHTDDSYFKNPAKATVLQALAIPQSGGETCFINTRKAFEEMPERARSNIENLTAVHAYDTIRASAQAQKLTDKELSETEDAEHPLVRTHEETGYKAIYFNPNRTDRVVGMDRKDSDLLLDVLYAWLTRYEFQYHHIWQIGDILLWDNRCLLHSVNVDYPIGQKRMHQRILLKGNRPV